MKFLCLGHLDEARWEALSEEQQQAQIARCMEYDEVLKSGHHFVGGDCLDHARTARTLRRHDGKVHITDGPYAETKELLGGILHLEARDMDHAVELISKHPGLEMGTFEIRPGADTPTALAPEDEVRALLARWTQAVEAKDVDTMLTEYTDDAVLFDAIPPYKIEGRQRIGQAWRSCLPFFPETFSLEHRDLTIHAHGNLAMVFGIFHFLMGEPDHRGGESWMRLSIGLRKVGGAWKIVHEHISLPFNPLDNQTWKIIDPDKLEAPDYGACQPCATV